jgi:hypothetical protein
MAIIISGSGLTPYQAALLNTATAAAADNTLALRDENGASNFTNIYTSDQIDASLSLYPLTTSLGTAAFIDVGTSANEIIQLDNTGKLPAVDGSNLTGLPSGSSVVNAVTTGNGLNLNTGTLSFDGSGYDVAGAASTAQSNAEDYADGLASNYDVAGAASTAQSNAESYADGLQKWVEISGTLSPVTNTDRVLLGGATDDTNSILQIQTPTYTIGDPTTFTATQNNSGTAFIANGSTYNFNLYAYKIGNGVKVASANSLPVTFVDDNSGDPFSIDLSWDAVANADGYIIARYVSTPEWYIVSGTSFTYDGTGAGSYPNFFLSPWQPYAISTNGGLVLTPESSATQLQIHGTSFPITLAEFDVGSNSVGLYVTTNDGSTAISTETYGENSHAMNLYCFSPNNVGLNIGTSDINSPAIQATTNDPTSDILQLSNASGNVFKIDNSGTVTMTAQSTAPTATSGGIYFDGTNFYMCVDGINWQIVNLT